MRYYLYNLKNVKNTHEWVILLVKLQVEACNLQADTKLYKASSIESKHARNRCNKHQNLLHEKLGQEKSFQSIIRNMDYLQLFRMEMKLLSPTPTERDRMRIGISKVWKTGHMEYWGRPFTIGRVICRD